MTKYLVGLQKDQTSKLAYEQIAGREPGIIFLPGLKSDMEGTKAKFLHSYCEKKHRSYIRFDYYGHGKSSGKFEDTTIKEWYSSLEILFKELTLPPQILVGSSLGGWIALHFAYKYPEKVKGVVGIASAVEFTDGIYQQMSKAEKEELKQKGYCEIPSDYDDGAYHISYRLITHGRRYKIFNKNPYYKCPIRLLHGLNDTAVDSSVSKNIIQKVKASDISLHLIEGADHSFSDERCLGLITRAIESI